MQTSKPAKKFVVDFGFSSTKVLSDDACFKFPSRYKAVGRETFVGNSAIDHGTPSDVLTVDKLVDLYKLFVLEAISSAGLSSDESLSLGVGLPAEFLISESFPGGKVEMLTDSLSSIPQISSVAVLAQGLGGITSFLSQKPAGNPSLVLGVDIGFNTAILTVWDNANSKIVDTTTLYRQGVCDLVKNHLYRLISSYTTGRAITPADYSYILETKTIPYGLERHDVSAQIAEASESYAADLLD